MLDGLRQLLDAHLSYPALLLDTYWDVVDSNASADRLLAGCAPHLLEPPVNVLRVCLHPDGIGRRIRNRDQWASHLYHQAVHRAEHTHDPRRSQLVDEVLEYLGGPPQLPATTGPVLALELDTEDGFLRFFSASAQIDTATDVTLAGLHLETFLPADAETRRAFG